VEEVAGLTGVAGGRYFVDTSERHPWLQGAGGVGLYEGLPYFLDDLRPSGFLGRAIAREVSRLWGVPEDAERWSDDQLGRYLLERGQDLPGDLVVGVAAAELARMAEHEPVEERSTEYPALAERALRGGVPGSSARGEQPKLTAYTRDEGHVIVKFSPASDSPEATRWRDLLRSEALALEAMAELGVEAAAARVFDFERRVFLESRRFDRVGARGRRPALSLSAVDAELSGVGQSWSQVSRRLLGLGLVRADTHERIVRAQTFGAWIGNTDMHLANLSLAPAGEGFELLPVYDMLPMFLAPLRGELRWPELRRPIRTRENEGCYDAAGLAAAGFWRRVSEEPRVSEGLRRHAAGYARIGSA